MRIRSRRALVATLAFLLVATLPVSAGAQDDQTGPDLRLRTGTFNPAAGERPDLPSGFERREARSTDQYVIQFDGPIPTSARAELEAAGVEVLGYIPDFAFRVRAGQGAIADAASRPDVVFTDVFQPAYKLDPAIGSADDVGIYRVRLADGANPAALRRAFRTSGIDILSFSGSQLTVAADGSQLTVIADSIDVAWVGLFRFNETHNEYGAGQIMNADNAVALGYDGSTQIVAVADTGIGDGTVSGAHVDIPASRVVAVHDWATSSARGCYRAFPDGAQDADSGHGTHVSGSVLSDGGPGGEGLGTAPAASLVFQAVEDYIDTRGACSASPDGYYLTGLPDDLSDLFQQAYDDGARIHSNSWGSSVAGDYTADSATVDQFMWDNPDMLITTSAGNAGIDANSDGLVDDDSMGSPATAKNLLTVGASENDRGGDYACDSSLTYTNPNTGSSCSSQSGANDIFTWGTAWPDDFPADPVASDASAGNAEQMAAFSSRGPTDDGRIKPDVVAPGSWILSGYSDLYQEGYDGSANPQNGAFQYDGWGFPLNDEYKYMGGTSMSNPLTAGAAAVVKDFYEKTDGHEASAALTKATLINSAVDMLDENNDGSNDNDYPIPNSHEGWGRVDLGAAVDGTAEYVDGDTVSTGAAQTYQHTVEAGTPLKVTLVWTDYPSDETAAVNLVNDLDLAVTSPGGDTYHGNAFSGGWSTTGGSEDRINNVENVYVQSPAAGTWTVAVEGFNVPFGPQPFALVVDAAFDGAPPTDDPPTVTVDAPSDGATVSGTISIDATASDDNGVDQVEFFVNGNPVGTDTTSPYSVSFDTTTIGDGSTTIEAVATDTIGQTDSDTVTVTVDNVVVDDPPTVTVDAPSDGATVSGTISIDATASDDNGVDQVEFFVNGNPVGTDTTSPYSVSFDTTTIGDGSTTIEAVATDTIGQTDSDTITVTVDNVVVDDPPTVTVDAPSDGATVSGTISIDATASDDNGVDQVEFFVNGNPVGTDTTSPYSVSFDTTTIGDGSTTIEAVATDTIGQTDSDTVTVTVDNSVGGGTTMHVGDLDGVSIDDGRLWQAELTVTIHDDTEAVVADATVEVTMQATNRAFTYSCVTDGSGTCTILGRVVPDSRVDFLTFTVDSVSHSSLTYSSGDNHDPDGDSDGTSLTVAQ